MKTVLQFFLPLIQFFKPKSITSYHLSSYFMSVTSVIITKGTISESSFHNTEAFKGHNIKDPLTLTLIRREFVMLIIRNRSWDRK